LATTLTQNTEELKSLLQYLDKDLLNRAISLAKQRYSIILKTVDDLIAKHRSEGLDIEHCRRVYYLTCLGPVSVSRRIYSDKSGKRRCLLDELMGMGRRGHNTLTVKEYAVELPTKMPYRRAAEVLGKLTAIEMTHQTMHRMVKKLSASYLETQIQQRQQFEATGEIPHSKGKTPAQIMIEADGVMVSQQRQKERKIEVKLGIAYEGWKEVSRGRYATENKTVFAAIGGSDNFWTDMTLELQKNYDFPGIRNVIIGGDGAAWVREGANYMGGHFQLDRYHLQRELTTALVLSYINQRNVFSVN